MDNVLYCDAIKGDFDLALLLQAGNMADMHAMVDDKIKKLPGVKDVCFLPVDPPQLPESVSQHHRHRGQGPGPGKGKPRSRQQRQFLRKALPPTCSWRSKRKNWKASIPPCT